MVENLGVAPPDLWSLPPGAPGSTWLGQPPTPSVALGHHRGAPGSTWLGQPPCPLSGSGLLGTSIRRVQTLWTV